MKKNLNKFKTETITSHSGKNPEENYGIPAPPLYRKLIEIKTGNIRTEEMELLLLSH